MNDEIHGMDWLDQKGAAAYLGVSRDVLRAATRAGVIRVLSLSGRTMRYHKGQLSEDAKYLGPALAANTALAHSAVAREWAFNPPPGHAEAIVADLLRQWFTAHSV